MESVLCLYESKLQHHGSRPCLPPSLNPNVLRAEEGGNIAWVRNRKNIYGNGQYLLVSSPSAASLCTEKILSVKTQGIRTFAAKERTCSRETLHTSPFSDACRCLISDTAFAKIHVPCKIMLGRPAAAAIRLSV